MTREGGRLPGVSAGQDVDPIVLHVDMDCFYAACERRREPALVGEPVVVGMGYEPGEDHGAVATASYEAREYGVESAQAISKALELLPRREEAPDGVAEAGYYRPVDMEYYESVAAEVKTILHECADTVREVSIDEAYLDVTDRTAWGVAEGYARHVKDRIDREVGVPASVGVAPSMSAAKIASDYDKPDGLVVIEPGEVAEFLAPLDIEALHGIGPVTAGELREAGVETIGDLAAADRGWLEDRFGERGRTIHRRANGEDERSVEPVGDPKSLNRESAFTEPVAALGRQRERIRELAADVAARARDEGAHYGRIGIKVVEPPFEVSTRARSLPGPVRDPDLVERVALDLFEEFAGTPVRKLGVRVADLSFADADQADLGGWADVSRDADDAEERSPRNDGRRGQVPLSAFDPEDDP